MTSKYVLYFSLAANVALLFLTFSMFNIPPPKEAEHMSPVRLNSILVEQSQMLKDIEESINTLVSRQSRNSLDLSIPSTTTASKNTQQSDSHTPAAVPDILDFNCGQYALGSQCFARLPHDYTYWNYKNGHSEFPDVCSIMNCIDEMGHLFGMHYPDKTLNSDNPHVGMLAFSVADFAFFDFVVSQHPELVNFTEFGTASGVTSLYIGMIAKIRGGNLITFDFRNTRCKESLRGWLEDVMTFKLADLLTSPNSDAIQALRRSPQIAFMDNGNKPKEINMYSRYLDVGSIIITHDYPGEWKMPEIQEELDARGNGYMYQVSKATGYIPIYEDYAYKLGSVARAFARVKPGEGVVKQ